MFENFILQLSFSLTEVLRLMPEQIQGAELRQIITHPEVTQREKGKSLLELDTPRTL